MSVLDRASLEASPLADLHTVASELSIDSYRRLRRPALIDAILERQGGAEGNGARANGDDADEEPAGRRRRGRRGGRSRSARDDDDRDETGEASVDAEAEGGSGAETGAGAEADEAEKAEDKPKRAPSRRPRKPKREPEADAEADADAEPDAEADADADADAKAERAKPSRRGRQAKTEEPEEAVEAEDEMVEGVVELLANGSGFIRVAPPEPSDQDVYISAAQVKRCELVSGDTIAGPRRAPRRSERFASLVRIDTINGRPADEIADSARYDDLPAAFPSERIKLGSEDPTLKAIEWLTPFGRGSRVTIVGPSRAGKTEALRLLAGALAGQDELQVTLALAGVRPEEIGEWSQGSIAPGVSVSIAYSADAQASAVELVVDQARRVAARGAHAVVLIDSLDGLHPHAARKVIAAARNLVDSGSLTVIATAAAPIGGETTVIALDRALTSVGRFPAIDLVESGTVRPELLVGDAGAEAIASARAEALGAQ